MLVSQPLSASKHSDLPGEVWDVYYSPHSASVARHVDLDDVIAMSIIMTTLPTGLGRVVSGAGGMATRLRRILCLRRTKRIW